MYTLFIVSDKYFTLKEFIMTETIRQVTKQELESWKSVMSGPGIKTLRENLFEQIENYKRSLEIARQNNDWKIFFNRIENQDEIVQYCGKQEPTVHNICNLFYGLPFCFIFKRCLILDANRSILDVRINSDEIICDAQYRLDYPKLKEEINLFKLRLQNSDKFWEIFDAILYKTTGDDKKFEDNLRDVLSNENISETELIVSLLSPDK
jgi:hypothetical protein